MSDNTRQTILATLVVLLLLALGVWWYFGFSLDFMRFFASEPPVDPAPPGDPAPPVAIIVTCSPATQTVAVGAAAQLTAPADFSSAEWFAPEGTPATGQGLAFSVTYAGAGTKKVTVLSPRNDGSTNVDSVECTVVVQ